MISELNIPLNCLDRIGLTPLHCACISGNSELIEYLVEFCGCDPLAYNEHDRTPFHYACYNCDIKTIELLSRSCDKAFIITKNSHTPSCFHVACLKGDIETVKYLVMKYNISASDWDGYDKTRSPLHFACLNSNLDIVRFLIDQCGANPICYDETNTMPIHEACFFGNKDTVKYLVEHCKVDCSVPTCSHQGLFPLHIACKSGKLKLVKYILEDAPLSDGSRFSELKLALHFACAKGNIEIVKYLIEVHKVDPALQDSNGLTPLHNALLRGSLEITRYLIEKHNVDPSIKNSEDGNTAIHYACRLNAHLNVLKYIVSKVINDVVLSNNYKNQSCLHFACQVGDIDVINFLLNNFNLSPNMCDKHGLSALHYASIHCHLDVVKCLVESWDADPMCCSSICVTSLHVCCANGSLEIAEYFIEQCKVDPLHVSAKQESPLHFACYSGNIRLIEYLAQKFKGANWNQIMDSRRTLPIEIACALGHLKVVEYLMEMCPVSPVKYEQYNNESLLHFASQSNCTPLVKFIGSKMKALPKRINKRYIGLSPLHHACSSAGGYISIVKYLVDELETCINCVSDRGVTPLHMACANGNLGIIQYLVKKIGIVDVNCKDSQGRTPLHGSCLNGNYDVMCFLLNECNADSHCVDYQGLTAVHYASSQVGNFASISDLVLRYKIDPNQSDNKGNLPLHLACQNGNLALVQFLIKHLNGCVKSCMNYRGRTLLHEACAHGHKNIFDVLINEHCADPNYKDYDGITPLHCACGNGHLQIVRVLIEQFGADPYSKSGKDLTPFYAACSSNNLEVVKYLVTNCSIYPMSVRENNKTGIYCTPLLIVCLSGNFNVARYIVQMCAPLEPSYSFSVLSKQHKAAESKSQEEPNLQLNPLQAACLSKNLEIVQYLVKECNIDPKYSKYGWELAIDIAASAGCLDIVMYLVESGVDPLYQDDDGAGLHSACHSGNLKLVQYFINQGCNPNSIANKTGNAPLHLACFNGSMVIVRYLVDECDADILIANGDGRLPIYAALIQGYLNVVEFLIAKALDKQHVLLPDPNGLTPLHCACLSGSVDLVNFLINSCGLNPLLNCFDNLSTLHLACLRGYFSIAMFLITEHDLNHLHKSAHGTSALHLACSTGSLSIIDFLLAHGNADAINEQTDDDMVTPFHGACKSKNLYLILYLLNECNVNLQLRSAKGLSPLHFACLNGHFASVKVLVPQYYSESDLVNMESIHPIELADYKESYDIVEYLIINNFCQSFVVENLRSIFRVSCANGIVGIVEYFCSNFKDEIMQFTSLDEEIGLTPLHLVIIGIHDCLELVESLTNLFDPNSLDNRGISPMQLACVNGCLSIVKFLIEKCNCDPKCTTHHDNSTLIHLACINGHLDVLKYLVNECNVDCYATNIDGGTVLHEACLHGYLEIVDFLLKNFAFVLSEAEDNEGRMPLFFACYNGQLNIVHYLINHYHCDPMYRNKQGTTPLQIAVIRGHVEVAKYLIQLYDLNPLTPNRDMTQIHAALILACMKGYLEIVHLLFKMFSHNISSEDGILPIHVASLNGHLQIVKFLVEECEGSTQHICDNNGWTAMHHACSKGHVDVVKYLFTTGKCDPMLKDLKRLTPFHLALANGHRDISYFLLPHICNDPLSKDICGYNALHEACQKGYVEIVQELIMKHGYELNCRINDLSSPLYIASESGQKAVVEYLIQCNCDSGCVNRAGLTPLHVACAKGHYDVMWHLIENHADPKREDKDGKQPLHHACINGHLGIARDLIVYRGCNPMCKDKENATPLHYACYEGHLNVVKFLLSQCKCDPNDVRNGGHTPLSLAYVKSHLEIVELLFCSGANIKSIKAPFVSQLLSNDGHSLRNKFSNVSNVMPVQSYVNICLIGDPGVGKSTLAQVIIERARLGIGNYLLGAYREVSGVIPQTAGIIPKRLEHEEMGNIILHDFAGQPEYYSSHISMLEDITGGLPVVFVILFKLGEQLPYKWLDVLRNLSDKCKGTCYMYVLAVASHADRYSAQQQVVMGNQAQEMLVRYFSEHAKSLRYNANDFVYLNCKLLGGDQLKKFNDRLASTCGVIREDTAAVMPEASNIMYCRMLYTLMENQGRVFYEMADIMAITTEVAAEYYLPSSEDKLKEIALLLQQMGFIKCVETTTKEFWIIFKIDVLLTEVNGVLFSPENFHNHRKIASDTGVVSKSAIFRLIAREYNDYNPDMIVEFLISRKLCEKVNADIVSQTNLKPDVDDEGNDYYFFPALMQQHDADSHSSSIRAMRANYPSKFQFGWCLKLVNQYEFFNVRLLHLLILRLAYNNALRRLDTNMPHQLRCHIWSNGIAWHSRDDVFNLVLMTNDSKAIVYLSSCRQNRVRLMINERKLIIQDILTLTKNNCPSVKANEYIIDPEQLTYREPMELETKDLYWVKEIADSIGDKRTSVLSCKNQSPRNIQLIDLLPYEYKEGRPNRYLSIFIREDYEGKPLNSYPQLDSGKPLPSPCSILKRHLALIFMNLTDVVWLLNALHAARFLSESFMQYEIGNQTHMEKITLLLKELNQKLSNNEFSADRCEKLCDILINDKDLYVKRFCEAAKRELNQWKCDSGYYDHGSNDIERIKEISLGASFKN